MKAIEYFKRLRQENWSLWECALLAFAYPWLKMVYSGHSPTLIVGGWIAYLAFLGLVIPKPLAIAGAAIPLGYLVLSVACGAILVTSRARNSITGSQK